MRAEHDTRPGPNLGGERPQRLVHAITRELDELALEMPALDERHIHRCSETGDRLVEVLPVPCNTQPRVMRREDDHDEPTDSVGGDTRNDIGDERVPIAHAEINGDVESSMQSGGLATRDVRKW